MTYLDIAEVISTLLTTPTIILSIIVVVLWGPKCYYILRQGGPKDAAEWFIVGVAVGFLGETLDNIYWNIPWSLSYINSSKAAWFHNHGVIANIPFRQTLGSIAAFCHIKSFVMHSENKDGNTGRNALIPVCLTVSVIASIVYILTLYLIRITTN